MSLYLSLAIRISIISRAFAGANGRHAAPWPLARTSTRLSASIAGTSRSNRYSSVCKAREDTKKTNVKRRKRRLDEVCCDLRPEHSRNVIQSWIFQGKVVVNGQKVTKAGTPVAETADVVILAEEPKYVCRAGAKLEKALDYFGIDVTGKVALDSGLSTGGFSDCMMQRGALKIFGVDVGYGQVAEKVRIDSRMVVMERTNLRHLRPQDLPCPVDVVTLDLSFISVLKVMPAVCGVLKLGGDLIVLIKPQFEAGKENVSKGGVVRDSQVHKQVIDKICCGISRLGFQCRGHTESPIKGDKSGNTEFLAHFIRDPQVPEGVPAPGLQTEEPPESD